MLKLLIGAIWLLNLCLCEETPTENEDGISVTFDAEQQSQISASSEEQEFQAEVSRLMEIIVNSLYRTRDIFMRELISNCNDAIDKIRIRSLTDPSALEANRDLEIKIQVDTDSGTVIIQDTGIGMTQAELAENLGTVAHSGTAAFVDAIHESMESGGGDSGNLIGQFGVGFYSAFLVADVVTVVSKSNDDPVQHIWQSTADGKYSISPDPRGNTLGRGTTVILQIKPDAREFLDLSNIERIISRYSQFIQYPIYLYSKTTVSEEVEKDESEEEEDENDLSVQDDEDDEPEMVDRVVWYWKRLNEHKPIWSRRPSQIDDEEYNEFYKAISKDTEDPLTHVHFRAEGEIEFDSILYIPSKPPMGMYEQYYNMRSALRLYVRRVLVADGLDEIVPRYLNFVRGLVDSNDLPLNVNREDLQKSKVMTVISRKLTRKVLDTLRRMALADEPDEDEDEEEEGEGEDVESPVDEEEEAKLQEEQKSEYARFWEQYGKSIKLGVIEDQRNKKRLIELLRFPSSKYPDGLTSLSKYVSEMEPGQKHIYYISGESKEEVEKSPFLQRLLNRGWEVLYFIDNLDEYLNLMEYDDIPFQAVSKEGIELDGQKMKDFLEEKKKEFADLRTWMKELYGSRVSRIQLSSSLQEIPMAVATAKYGASAHMDKLTRSQAFGGQAGARAIKVLQLNYRHPIIIDMRNRIEDGEGEDSQELQDLANLMLDAALTQSGFDLDSKDYESYGDRVHRIVRSSLEIPLDQELEPVPEFYDEVDEEEEEDWEDDEEEDEDELDMEDHDEL